MSAKDLFYPTDHVESVDFQMADQRERLIYNVTEDLLVLMEEKGITRSKLAEMLGQTKSNISRLLNGERNMTLATLSDLCFHLGVKPSVFIPLDRRIEANASDGVAWLEFSGDFSGRSMAGKATVVVHTGAGNSAILGDQHALHVVKEMLA